MNKKIDFFNKDNKDFTTKNISIKTTNMGRNPKKLYGSKTPKIQKPKTSTDTGPKRRGRRPKKILDSVSTDSENLLEESNPKNDSAVILRIPFDPSKHKLVKNLKTKKTEQTKKIITDVNLNDYDNDESSEGMFKNDIPGDNTCQKCIKNEKMLNLLKTRLEKYENKEKFDKSNKIYSNNLNFISFTTGKKVIIKKTNIWCWWDGHPFTNLPCVLPELYHNETYHVIGCFCSFNCALAYNLYHIKDSKIYHRKSLVYKLYREMYGLSADYDADIAEAPPRERLLNFGGKMTIDAFRRSLIMINKEYIVYMPPIKPISITIEERNTNTDNDDNGEEFVLKRKKPLSKKRSIISSMKIKVDDDNNSNNNNNKNQS